MRLPVRIDLRPLGETLDIIQQALEAKCKPRSWRPSEYAMTKATAKALWDTLKSSEYHVEADYFNWSCLTGELARYYKHCYKQYGNTKCDTHVANAGNALKVFTTIYTACLHDEKVAAMIAASQKYIRSEKKLNKLTRRVEAMKLSLLQKEKEVRQQKAQLGRE